MTDADLSGYLSDLKARSAAFATIRADRCCTHCHGDTHCQVWHDHQRGERNDRDV